MVLEQVREMASAWEEARRCHANTVALANRRVHAAERRVDRALHGLPLDRWKMPLDGNGSLARPRVARQVHLAAKSRQEVEIALIALAEARTASEADHRRTQVELHAAIRRILPHGRLGERLTGCSAAELSRIADDRTATRMHSDARQEIDHVTTREAVRDCQRRIAQLDATYTRARAQLDAARHKRSDLLAAQDEQVSIAEREIDKTVVTMVTELGTELAAKLTGLEVSEVRRLLKRQK